MSKPLIIEKPNIESRDPKRMLIMPPTTENRSDRAELNSGVAGQRRFTTVHKIEYRGPAPELIHTIMELQAARAMLMRSQLRLQNQAAAYVRRCLGFDVNATEKERAKLKKESTALVKIIEAGETPKSDDHKAAAEAAAAMVSVLQVARQPMEEMRKKLEKRLIELAKTLPPAAFVESTPGFSYLGLATIVGECGDIGGYRNPSCLWKRMGLGCINGEAQHRTTDAEKAILCGYNPRRRSVIWMAGYSLLMQEGPYRDLYRHRLAREVEKAGPDHATIRYLGKKIRTSVKRAGEEYDSFSIHACRRAQRYVEKRLLLHLWLAWKGISARTKINLNSVKRIADE